MSHDDVDTPVAIVGAGPVGLSLALGLAHYGVPSVLLERNRDTSGESRAPGIHVRTLEALGQWGVAESLRAAGEVLATVTPVLAGGRRVLSIDFSALAPEADRPGILVLEQSRTEQLLLAAVRRTGRCEVRFGAEAVGLVQNGDRATVTVRQAGVEQPLTAAYVVGCDGADSFVRGALGLPFDGLTYALQPVLADVRIEDERDTQPWPRIDNDRGGITAALRLRPRLWRIIRLDAHRPTESPEDRSSSLVAAVLGPGPAPVVWASRFRIHRRSAPRFRVGRVLLAGDAAHIHSPVGGQGMNAGIQDVHNLAWKLAYALAGADPEPLLDSYDVERRQVVGSVSRYTDVLTRLLLQSPSFVRVAGALLGRAMLAVPALRRRSLRRATMTDLSYRDSPVLGRGGRAAGRRLPNPVLVASGGGRERLHDLLPTGPALLHLTDADLTWPGLPAAEVPVIRIGRAGYRDPSGSLRRLLGHRSGWLLVRPDTHIAWSAGET